MNDAGKVPLGDAPHRFSRRQLLAALAGAAAYAPEVLAMQTPGPEGIPLRPLGKTGVRIPIVGYGGWHAVAEKPDEESIRLMHEAIDLGFTFFDNAWEYHNGRAEEVMGRALQPASRRDKVFLMTKVCARDYEGARRHIEDSLRRLRTDRVDLLQFHAIQYEGDPQRIFDPEKGALKAALEARQAGKARFIGFTGHRDPKVHLEMLGRPFAWDTVQMPLNVLDAHYRSFEKEVLPEARRREVGVLGMKSLGGGMAPVPVVRAGLSAELCRRYALSLPVSSVVCGMTRREELLGMVRIARQFQPLSQPEIAAALGKAGLRAGDGRLEAYKDPKQGYGCSWHARVLSSQG